MKICLENCSKCIHFYKFIVCSNEFDDTLINYCDIIKLELFYPDCYIKKYEKYWSQFDCSEFEKK